MRTNQAVKQWASTLQADKALEELKALKAKYPWLRCDKSMKALETINSDLPKLISIITHQDKQNAMHNEFVRVSKIADEAMYNAIVEKYKIEI